MACFYQDHKCWCKIIKREGLWPSPFIISWRLKLVPELLSERRLNHHRGQSGPKEGPEEQSYPAAVWTCCMPVRCECTLPLKSLLQLKDRAASRCLCRAPRSRWFLEFPKVEQEALSHQTAVVVWHDANKSESNYTKEEKTRLWTNYFCMNSVSYTKFTHLAFSSMQ